MKRVHSGTGRARRGQIMVLFAMMVPTVLAFMGLSLDVGRYYHIKRRMQTAADAGAMGGAHELWRRNFDLITPAAKGDSGLNGFKDGSNSVTVIVNRPPATGARAGDASFVEVIVEQPVPSIMLRYFGPESATVRARGVAGMVAWGDGCVLALDPLRKGALTVAGTATLTSSCGVMVNSIDDRALTVNGGGCIYATGGSGIGVTGSYISNGSANCTYPPPTADTPPALNPLAYMAKPVALAGTPTFNNKTLTSGGSRTDEPFIELLPGIYTGGIKIAGANVTFLPGTYIMDGGGFEVTGNSIINGDGVTFFSTKFASGGGGGGGAPLQCGEIHIGGDVTATLSAPSEGPYAGMLFWMDNNCPYKTPGSEIVGTSASKLVGALYFPTTPLKYAGTSQSDGWTIIVAQTIDIVGTSDVNNDYAGSTVPVPLRKVTLVE